VTLTAPATSSGGSFTRWERDGIEISTSNSTSVSATGNFVLTAVYGTPNNTFLTLQGVTFLGTP